jgi:hypothetical protein
MSRLARWVFLLVAFAAASEAQAYCLYNGLRDRSVSFTQEEHPERSREPRKLKLTLQPGQQHCCNFYNLDCNPGGREEAVVGLAITIVEEPDVKCGLPAGRYKEHQVSITGTSNLRVMPNNRRSETVPYVIRVRARDGKDLSGPTGVACRKPSKE